MYTCKYCLGNEIAATLHPREMMYGTREVFEYHSCAACQSLQIIESPAEMGNYYNRQEYSSWGDIPEYIKRRPPAIRRLLIGQRTDYALNRQGLFGKMLTNIFGEPTFPPPYDWDWFRHSKTDRKSKILDFGCGTAALLYFLRANGFKHLFGVDPFSGVTADSADLRVSSSLDRKWLGQFDLVMMHHSLEHVTDPEAQIKALLPYARPGGAILIRVPIADSQVARQYGENWVQLDAPRHLAIPSEKGLLSLGSRLGLRLEHIKYDSTAFQFIGSAQYAAGIWMYDPENSWLLGKNSPYGAQERQDLEVKAKELNHLHQGDQATFLWRVPADSASKH